MSEHFFALVLQKSIKELDGVSVAKEVVRLSAPIGFSAEVLQDRLGDKPALLEVGGTKISVSPVSTRVPAGTMEGAAYASLGWSAAKEAIDEHKAHWIVGCVNLPNDHEQALHFAVVTTLVTEAVRRLVEGTGVFWSTGQIMISPETWQQATSSILEKKLPVEDWINLFWTKGDKGTLGAVTEGARAFFGMEIEFALAPLQPADIAGRLFGLVQYLLVNGAVLKDGDTLGQNNEETIRVRFKDRGTQFDGRVIELSFEPQRLKPSPLPGLGGGSYSTSNEAKSKPQIFGKQGSG